MNIRALTGFVDPGWPLEARRIADLAACLRTAKARLEEAGYPVQTLRLATPPAAEMNRPVRPSDRPELARQLEAEAFVNGIDYASLGPALIEEPDGFTAVPDILGATENVFTSAIYCDAEAGLSLPAARGCAQAIRDVSRLSGDGFANLRFAALANVPPGTPFFPAAYHSGSGMAIAAASEAAELAVDALREVSSIGTARRRLVGMIEAHGAALARPLQAVAAEHEARFLGIDFSLAPYPDQFRSIGAAIESFGAGSVGGGGSVAAVAFLADCLDRADFKRTGFSGVLLSVLEDEILAARAAGGQLAVNDLMLYSTMCGTGLDAVPLPGDASLDGLTGLLLDLGVIALRLRKPLTARLMPIPGKSAGDEVHFDFPYFADSRVLALREFPLGGLLAGAGLLDIGQLSGA
jgi:uncharacterized protein (UPF0210 family)